MRRREFIALLGGSALASLAANAQEAGRVYRLGVLHPLPRAAPQFAQLIDGLRRQGFIEGRNLAVDPRGFESRSYQYHERADELVKFGVDVLVCGGDETLRAARQVTRAIPLVGVADDMVASGLVTSLGHPGANTTGFSILSTELDGKRQRVLSEFVPRARRMAALFDPGTKSPAQLQEVVDIARAYGVTLSTHRVTRKDEIVPAMNAAKAAGAEALNVMSSVLLNALRPVIFEQAAALRLPTIYQFPESAEEDGFVGYGPRIEQIYRDMAVVVAKLFLGERPQDLPVQRPTTFELVINLKTGNALGLTIPEALLIRADKVIE